MNSKLKWEIRRLRKLTLLLRRRVNIARNRSEWVFGDSHTEVFDAINERFFGYEKFIVVRVDGATALGLANPNSNTDALRIFRTEYRKTKLQTRLNFLLGEVDAGFLIWYRHQKQSIDVEESTATSIHNYESFLREVISAGRTVIRIFSVPLPVIADYAEWEGRIANMRKQVIATQLQRTDLTLRYNSLLARMAERLGAEFVDCDTDLLGSNGLIRQEFVNKNPLDHHLDSQAYASMLMAKIKPSLR